MQIGFTSDSHPTQIRFKSDASPGFGVSFRGTAPGRREIAEEDKLPQTTARTVRATP